MRLTASRSIPVFGVGLALAAGLGQGDARLPMALPGTSAADRLAPLTSLPWALVQAPKPRTTVPKLYAVPRPFTSVPRLQSPRAPGDVIPHSYLVFGLRTGPGGMAFTDRNGAVIPVPSNAQIDMGPFSPRVFPPTFTLPGAAPPVLTLPKPAPKK